MIRINQSEEDTESELPDLHERYEFNSEDEDKKVSKKHQKIHPHGERKTK